MTINIYFFYARQSMILCVNVADWQSLDGKENINSQNVREHRRNFKEIL